MLLSAFILAACGNGEKEAAETTDASTTKLKQQLLGLLLGQKKYPLQILNVSEMKRLGYINIPKDWVVRTTRSSKALEYLSPDKHNALIMDSNTKRYC